MHVGFTTQLTTFGAAANVKEREGEMKAVFVGVAFAIFMTAIAAAEPLKLSRPTLGYTYFNRPGADLSAQGADLIACIQQTRTLQSADQHWYSSPTYVTHERAERLFGGIFLAGYQNSVVLSGIENCMVVRGWRVVKIPDAEGEGLTERSSEDIAQAIEPWVGQAQPQGEIVRAWNNDAAHSATDRFELRPASTPRGSLSLDALNVAPPADSDTLPSAQHVQLDRRWPTHNLSPAQFSQAPSDGAVVIFQLHGASFRNGNGVTFERISNDPQSPASAADHAPDIITLFASAISGGDHWFAFSMPAGRWRIASIYGGINSVSFCLGSPSFEVAAGEVVYGGRFDLAADSLGPDLSLDAPRAWLQSQPAQVQVRAAAYTNGWTGACSGNAAYALEAEGAPFRDGYLYGSRARAGTTSGEIINQSQGNAVNGTSH